MTVWHSIFPERLFEFIFNSEFIFKNSASVIGLPHIPSQKEEEWLGYDVAFELQQGSGVIGALALQHKVARLVHGPGSPANAEYTKVVGKNKPYLGFPIDPFQFNVIEQLASQNLTGLEFYYCAPLFVDKANLDARYLGRDLDAHSVYIDVSGVGRLDESVSHSMIYTPAGNKAWVFSAEPRELKIRTANHRSERQRISHGRLSMEEVAVSYSRAFEIIESEYARRLREDLETKVPADIDGLPELLRATQQMRLEMPQRTTFSNEGECWRAIGRLFARYLNSTTIVEEA